MLNTSSEHIASFFVQNKVIEKEDKEICAYGLELILATVVNVLLVLLVGAILDCLIETLVFLISFATIRGFAGGYHANTHRKCIMIFMIVYILNLIVLLQIPLNIVSYSSFIVSVISVYLIFRYAPVEHKNRPLSQEEKVKFKQKSRYSALAASIIVTAGHLSLPVHNLAFFSISLGLLTAALSTVVVGIKNERR